MFVGTSHLPSYRSPGTCCPLFCSFEQSNAPRIASLAQVVSESAGAFPCANRISVPDLNSILPSWSTLVSKDDLQWRGTFSPYYDACNILEVDPIEEFFNPVSEVEYADQFFHSSKGEGLVSFPEKSRRPSCWNYIRSTSVRENPGDLDDEGSIHNYEVGSTGLQEVYPCQSLLDL